ncbi:MAG: 50S ribosomal protein L16 [Planctomycetota bacterium]|jgi:large subunit ribosomal protein L16
MVLMPNRPAHRKVQRGRVKGEATRGNTVEFGEFGLQSLEAGWLSGKQIEAGRVAASRAAREAKIYIRVFPQKPITATPAETRMGKGKGEPDFWAAVIKPGTIIYELGGINEQQAVLAFNRVAHKLPLKVRFVRRRMKV